MTTEEKYWALRKQGYSLALANLIAREETKNDGRENKTRGHGAQTVH